MRRTFAIRTVMLLGSAMAMPALAQETPREPPAEAQSITQDQGDGDIVVTARRRAESVIDVPIAMSVVTGDQLTRTGAVDITALQDKTPNLTLQIARGSNSTLIAFSRGVGQQDPLWGFEPGVGLYLDDVYVARPQGAVLDIFDVERVEVLRGPQGTLYGRNTIGGAIKYVTKRLGNDYAATARASYGSYNQFDLVGQVTVPLTDSLAIGGAVARYKRDGYGTNLTTGADQYDKDVLAARVSAEWTPSDSVFVRLAGDRTLDRSNPRHGTRLLGNGTDARYAPTASVYDTRAGVGDRNRVVAQGLSLTGEFGLSDTLTFKSISAYREGATNTVIDFDNTALPTLDVPAEYDDWQFTQELQLLLQGDRLQGVFGLFYLNAEASGAFDTVLGGLNLTTLTAGEVKTRSYAAFGDLSYDLTDKLRISAGLRYTKDDKTGTVFRRNYTGIRSTRFGNAAAVPGLIRTDYTNNRSFDQFTPRVSIAYEPRPDLNLYASWGKGFKSGGFDMRGDAVFTPTTVNGYDPEKISSTEIGMKGAFLNRTLFLNLAGYYSRYTDQQVTIQVPNVAGGIASFVDNAGKADIYGLEIEGRMVPSRHFSAQVSFGYTNADYKEFLTFVGGGTTPVDVANSRVFQNTPEFTAAASFTASTDVAGGTLSITPEVTLRSDYSLFEIPTPALDQDGYALVNAAANWISEGGRYRLGVALRNLTDQRYRVGGYNFPGALFGNSVIGYYGPPRTATATFEVRF
ncbi:TonB-dependent receptor [Sphingomonas sp. Leaf407]|uniref:TonB-dependent receptor n=1 Tax=unclassified Sphingomonas TaxID=196159 RepID=UPI0006F5EA3F|nr:MULTISPECIES: TonB-dependent receptor [unclassified Sphingomonas]KQN35625.1 TonB-dependent receptor [Sphingomonas sp. Leaf42]KQT26492.1 TonB-dependent receptor [Sphingomonas sp. Leaf407]